MPEEIIRNDMGIEKYSGRALRNRVSIYSPLLLTVINLNYFQKKASSYQ